MRADQLLWSLRYFKSRNLASKACKSGRIKVLGKSIKPSKEIFIGDKIFINKDQILKGITVLKLPKSRIGPKVIDLHRKEEEIVKWAKRSLVTTKELRAGELIKVGDIWSKRPYTGIPSKNYYKIIGRKLKKNLKKNKILKYSDLK